MSDRFSTPASQPITIGDQYTEFKRSVIPVVPVVDDPVALQVKVSLSDVEDGTKNEKRERDEEVDQGDSETTCDAPTEHHDKKQRTDDAPDDDSREANSGPDSQDESRCEAPAIHRESDDGESKDRVDGDSVRTEREQDHTESEAQ